MADTGNSEQTMSGNSFHQDEDSADSMKYTFENGRLSFLGTDVEVLPQKLINDYSNVTLHLDLSFNRLRSLRGIEQFHALEELVLDNNELSDNVVFPQLRSLHTLTLNKNKIADLHGLLEQLVRSFNRLTYLSLLGNQACPNELSSLDKDHEDYLRYRYYVLYKLPGLKFLDSTPVTAAEVVEAKRVGPYMKVVRPVESDSEKANIDSVDHSSGSQYTPLPADSAPDHAKHQGVYGKNKFIYHGRHSEGNRFIVNTDL